MAGALRVPSPPGQSPSADAADHHPWAAAASAGPAPRTRKRALQDPADAWQAKWSRPSRRREQALDGIELLREDRLQDDSFGVCNYKVWEACDESQRSERPLLLVWLHGQDMSEIGKADLLRMQKRLGRRTLFLVPLNPTGGVDRLRFYWGVSYTKAQNKGSMGFVFGELHRPFLTALTGLVADVAHELSAAHVVVAGYSMGGFGAYQLAGHAPDVFDVAVPVAGYGLGTLEPSDRGLFAPQPASSQVLEQWLGKYKHSLAQLPALLVVHSPADQVSSCKDAEAIVGEVNAANGNATLLEVPDEVANSDNTGRKRKSKPSGHGYFNYALLNEESKDYVWAFIRDELDRVRPR